MFRVVNVILVMIALLSIQLRGLGQSTGTLKSTVTKGSGGSIQTPLDKEIIVNKESSLVREWVTIQDVRLPVKFKETVGVTSYYSSGSTYSSYSKGYRYQTNYSIEIKEPIAAIEVRFLLFDLWGNHTRTLSQTEVADMKELKKLSGRWDVYSETEVSVFYASIAYIARVRMMDGRVIEGETATVVEEAKKISKKFLPENLEPKVEKK